MTGALAPIRNPVIGGFHPDPFPAVLWCHWHGGDYQLGTEAIDRACYTPEAQGPALARRGNVLLGVDAMGLGQRNGRGPDGTEGSTGEASIVKHGLSPDARCGA